MWGGMKRARWRCYWQWPLGHRWEHVVVDQHHGYKRCGDCGKTKGAFRPSAQGERFGGHADWGGDGGGSD